MKKLWNKTGLAVLGLTIGLSAMNSSTAFAGQWQNQGGRFWWQNDDGSYPVSTWQWLDGDQDGVAEQYYFDENGYLLVNTTTPDQRTVNENGAWVSGGAVQRQTMKQTNTRFGKYNNETNRAALKAYRKTLETDYNLQGLCGQLSSFALIDLNSDGIYEMYVYVPGCSNADTTSYICWYTDNIVSKRPLEYYHGFHYKPGTGFFMTDHGYETAYAEYFQFDGNCITKLSEEYFIRPESAYLVDYMTDDPEAALYHMERYQTYCSESLDIYRMKSEVTVENLDKYFGN